MKKIVMTILVVAMMITGALSVAAAGINSDGSNMDEGTYLTSRLSQIEEALTAKTIDADQAALLRNHINEMAAEGNFGHGSQYGLSDEDNEDCVLGEEGNLGLFSNENSGQKKGAGNGASLKAQDGTHASDGTGSQDHIRGNRANGAGQQLQDGSNGANR